MGKQIKNTNDAPVDNEVDNVVATNKQESTESQTSAIQTEPQTGEINNDNNPQGATPENLDTETKSKTIESQENHFDNIEFGKSRLLNGSILFEVSLKNLPRHLLEQIVSDCKLGLNTKYLSDDELRFWIDEIVQQDKAKHESNQVEYEEVLSESDKEKFNKIAKSVFDNRNYETIYLTSDGVPFETENTAKQHAMHLENKMIVKRTRVDL